MVDEPQAENVTPVAETEVVESPTTEEKTVPQEEPKVEAPEVNPEVKTETPKEEGPKSSEPKPVEKRIHKLVDERDRAREEKESLARQVEQLTTLLSGNQGVTPQFPTIEPGAEVTPEQYKRDVAQTAQTIAQLEIQKERVIERINKEAQESMSDHPELDPKSEVFDKELSDTITESVRAQIQVNPHASVKTLVNRLMKPYRRSVEKKVAEETATVAKQATESALRPSQVKQTEKPFEELTPQEMEKRLGVVY